MNRLMSAIIVCSLIAGLVFALWLMWRNTSSRNEERMAAEERQKKDQQIKGVKETLETMVTKVRLTDDERAIIKKNGTGENGIRKSNALIMGKNPMSIKAFRAARAPLNAFYVGIQIEDIDDWGDWSSNSGALLGYSVTEVDGTDAGFAVIEKKYGKDLFELTKDGKRHLIIGVFSFVDDHKDPMIVWYEDP